MILPEFLDICSSKENRVQLLESLYPKFIACLTTGSEHVAADYFILSTAGEDEIEFRERERVYCYELYHQIRSAIDKTENKFSPFILNGEVDKKRHVEFKEHPILKNTIPDFLFHTPGYMEGNFVVVEVKPLDVMEKGDRKEKIVNDLKKLTAFVNDKWYFQGIYLVYGKDIETLNNFKDLCIQIKDELNTDEKQLINLSAINLYWHSQTGNKAELVNWEN